ncbi:MAG: 2-dehydropantoate 2-reductase, partial [Planctomycetota bacterium]
GAILVTLQNGIEAPALVAGLFPGHPVIAGSAFIGARIERPGCVVHSAAGLIRIAPWAHADEEHMASVLDLLDQAGVPVERCEDARTMLWHKMLWNCGFNAITALTRRHARDIACFDETARIAREAMLETLRAAVADGARLDEEEVDRQMRITRELGPVKTSMWQDIEQGRKTEIEAMNGQVVVVSREHGLDAPVNAMLTALIHALEAREH